MDQETYRAERELLIKAEQEQSRSYDRAILTLAAGALGLSLTFIKEIVPDYDHGTVYLLSLGWGFFILGLLSTLISFLVSQSALRRARFVLDDMFSSGSDSPRLTNRFARLTNYLNWTSMAAFIAGVICLVIFATDNL